MTSSVSVSPGLMADFNEISVAFLLELLLSPLKKEEEKTKKNKNKK